MLMLTKFFHSTLGHISAIISDNAMGKAKTENHLFDELNCHRHVILTDRLSPHHGIQFSAFSTEVLIGLDQGTIAVVLSLLP